MRMMKRFWKIGWMVLVGALVLEGCGIPPQISPETGPAEPLNVTQETAETEALVLRSSEALPETAAASESAEAAVTTEAAETSTEAVEPFVYQGLVELTEADERILIDQRYATKDNFTGRVHYDRVLCLVQEDVLPMLIRAADLAEAAGCRIKIWDAYRPVSVQQALHDSAPPELAAYVPAPGPWSMHARGITVDVTLCDMEGNELDMPTGFDDFSPRANSDSTDATDRQIANRELLNGIMTEAGFTRSRLEWWHFDGPNRDRYQVLDVSFGEFEAARDRAE